MTNPKYEIQTLLATSCSEQAATSSTVAHKSDLRLGHYANVTPVVIHMQIRNKPRQVYN